jgi:PilZ domain
VHAGNCEITNVFGGGRVPSERARIVNFSRGGLLLKVPSPRRRFLFVKQDPVIQSQDMLACTVRLPPLYTEVHVQGEVVHVARVADEPDTLHVGLSFNEVTSEQKIVSLARLIEPASSSGSGSTSKRVSQRSKRVSQRSKRVSQRSKRVKQPSQRLTQPAAGGTSGRVEAEAADRSGRGDTQRLSQASGRTVRVSGRQSKRLRAQAEAADERPATPSKRVSRRSKRIQPEG